MFETPSCGRLVAEVFKFKRFVDGPIQALTLLLAVANLIPGGTESSATQYRTLLWISTLLLAACGFLPTFSTISSLLFMALFSALYNSLVNPFEVSALVGIGVLIAHSRVRVAAGSAFAYGVTYWLVNPWPHDDWWSNALGLLLAVTLGLSARHFERVIHKQMRLREEAVRQREREISRAKLHLALDVHDSVSHGLTTQASIISVMTRDCASSKEVSRELLELSLINTHTHAQLRALLNELNSQRSPEHHAVDFAHEFSALVHSVCTRVAAGGMQLHMQLGRLPAHLGAEETRDAIFIFQEIVTNMVRYTAGVGDCVVSVETALGIGGISELVFRGSNPAREMPTEPPASLARRSQARGGSCHLTWGQPSTFSVIVTLPVESTVEKMPRLRYAPNDGVSLNVQHANVSAFIFPALAGANLERNDISAADSPGPRPEFGTSCAMPDLESERQGSASEVLPVRRSGGEPFGAHGT